MLPRALVVRQTAKETHDTLTLTLEPTAAASGVVSAGTIQHALGVWRGGVAHLDQWRPGEHERLVYTVRSVGRRPSAGQPTAAADCVGVRGPFGTGWPLEAARGKDVIIVAGGIGLAPLRPRHLPRPREPIGVWPRSSCCMARAARVICFIGKNSQRGLKQPDTQVLVTVDYGGLSWRGHVGVVTTLFKYAAAAAGHVVGDGLRP